MQPVACELWRLIMAESSGSKQGPLARWRETRRVKKELTGDSPERLAERHRPKRDWVDMMAHAAPGGQRHSNLKGDRR
jgi:hypothetical protein